MLVTNDGRYAIGRQEEEEAIDLVPNAYFKLESVLVSLHRVHRR